mmetsp:Transcript_13661/g.12252  ORF Transcript_13661/g.12252 Transcript_13661/m.12252 type:complete len:202 (+) Transcript_13661:1513-2118(+)
MLNMYQNPNLFHLMLNMDLVMQVNHHIVLVDILLNSLQPNNHHHIYIYHHLYMYMILILLILNQILDNINNNQYSDLMMDITLLIHNHHLLHHHIIYLILPNNLLVILYNKMFVLHFLYNIHDPFQMLIQSSFQIHHIHMVLLVLNNMIHLMAMIHLNMLLYHHLHHNIQQYYNIYAIYLLDPNIFFYQYLLKILLHLYYL